MTLDTLIETGKILSYSEGEGYVVVKEMRDDGSIFNRIAKGHQCLVIYMKGTERRIQPFEGITRKDVTQQVIKYFS